MTYAFQTQKINWIEEYNDFKDNKNLKRRNVDNFSILSHATTVSAISCTLVLSSLTLFCLTAGDIIIHTV